MNAALGVLFAFLGVLAMPFICPFAGENAISIGHPADLQIEMRQRAVAIGGMNNPSESK
jgi:hypothetical protein